MRRNVTVAAVCALLAAPASAHAAAPAAGSYTGGNPQNGSGLTFYVAGDGASVQDVSIPHVVLSCTGAAARSDHVDVGSIPIGANGAFSSTTVQDGVVDGVATHFTYAFQGRFQAGAVTGTFREAQTYNDGTAHTCTSNVQSWKASRDSAQASKQAPDARPGSYSGLNPQNGSGLAFSIAADRASLQDLSVGHVALSCSGAGAAPLSDHVDVPSIPIGADGSFSSTATQNGVLLGVHARYTYQVTGHVHGDDASARARVAGTFRETIAYDDGKRHTCTSNLLSFGAGWDAAQAAQQMPDPRPGSHSGLNPQNGSGLTFFITADRHSLQDVLVAHVVLGCTTPGPASLSDHVDVGRIPIGADGSFASTTRQDGVLTSGVRARFTYVFNGHVHGDDARGLARIAGTFRENITWNDGTAHSCTSNRVSFGTVWESAQAARQLPDPRPGAWAGLNPQNGSGLAFSIAPNRRRIRDVTISHVYLYCTPAGARAVSASFLLRSVPIARNGSFAATRAQRSVVNGVRTRVTYELRGHVHGDDANGRARLAGMFRETETFGTSRRRCTSNWVSFQAASAR
jgi:hypothetical protein